MASTMAPMKPVDQMKFHPITEKIVAILCNKTQNYNPLFFRILVSYHLTKIASMMRVSILTEDRGDIPINLYAINLGNSGLGKGHATNIIEDQLLHRFKDRFFDSTYPVVVDKSLNSLAVKRANILGEDPDSIILSVEREFKDLGPLPFAFDSGTTAAVKQMRHKLLMANIGSMNLEIDEIGSNLLGNADVLSTFLELFDMGKVKQKLTKNTRENQRNEEITGQTPTNLLLFGTPAKLLNGGKTEDEFYSFLETGYARRALFGYTRNGTKSTTLDPEDIYNILIDPNLDKDMQDLAKDFGNLAHPLNHKRKLVMSKAESLLVIQYRLFCEERATEYGEYEEIRKAEMEHRYFKATKLAGTYAFLAGQSNVTSDDIYAAIRMVEESGIAFNNLLRRERNYTKLAKYIAEIRHEVTHADLTEDLPFYKGAISQKTELMQLAIAWGYKNQIIIKKTVNNGIEFMTGETLTATDLKKLTLAYSSDITTGYNNTQAPFKKLFQMAQTPDLHWINHHVADGYRKDTNIIHGFNMVVLDVDEGVTMDAAKLLLQNYTYLLYTTKRHTTAHHRFRLILPLNYNISLDTADYKEFMKNIFDWLPFDVDTQTGQRSRKWLTHKGHYEYNHTDQLLDALLFIPKTAKNDAQKQLIQTHQSLSNLERWFIQNMDYGNRNNQILKYGLMLADMGYNADDAEQLIYDLNSKLDKQLTKHEIKSTILITVSKHIDSKGVV